MIRVLFDACHRHGWLPGLAASATIYVEELPFHHDQIARFIPEPVMALVDRGLVKGQRIGVDATTLEANAAMRSIVRRDTGRAMRSFWPGSRRPRASRRPRGKIWHGWTEAQKDACLIRTGGIPDGDARIAKMKDGRTHLAHKAEHAVDLETGAVVAVTLQGADQGDTTTLDETLSEAGIAVAELVGREAELRADDEPKVNVNGIEELVADKGYHSGAVVERVKSYEVRSYIPEKQQRGRRNWRGKQAEQRAVYQNRRRVRGSYGKSLLRRRGELVERSFAHCYETGGMRRTHLRKHQNILKRQLIHIGAFNLSLILRRCWVRESRGSGRTAVACFFCLFISFSRAGGRGVSSAEAEMQCHAHDS